MLASFSEFKFYQSFRVPVEEADGLRFLVEMDDDLGKSQYINDAKLVDISVTGLGFETDLRLSVGTDVDISLQFKKTQLDLTGTIVRAFSNALDDEKVIYGVELDHEKKLTKFLEQYIHSFSPERLKDCLASSALKERYSNTTEGFEVFSLLLSLFSDITHFGEKEGFIDNMLEEVVRLMGAQRASIFLINPDTNELEAIEALGVKNKEALKFDYRLGIAGSVFTTGVALNIDIMSDSTRFNEDLDKKTGFETKSIICHPIHNREDKIIGVIEVLNKRNEQRFDVEDEKTMKVLSLVFSSVYHNFSPLSEKSQIRRFSTPFDREYALIGRTSHMGSLRNTILKIKDLDSPVLIQGEHGVGKSLYAKVLHYEGCRGLKTVQMINCKEQDQQYLEAKLWGPDEECKFVACKGGSLILQNICELNRYQQDKLAQILIERKLPNSKVSPDVRLVCTSDKDLGKLVDEGHFSKELYEYISEAYVYMEPLRRRVDDIEDLVDYFLKMECKKQGLLLKSISPKVIEQLKQYDWPHNVQELKTCIERTVLYNPKVHMISNIDLKSSATPLVDVSVKRRMFGDVDHVSNFHMNLKDRLALVEREMILAEIKRNNGNKSKAAKEMGISREALRKKLIFSDEILEKIEAEKKDTKEEIKEDMNKIAA